LVSALPTGACRCYIRAAKDLGLYAFRSELAQTFGAFAWDMEGRYEIREVEDCNQGLDSLIFTFLPRVDGSMIEFSNM
ncbi:Acyl-CoA N-acetyltransferase, partial [Cedratvirus Zaza IHUMI]